MNLFGRVIICGQVAEYNVAPEDRFGIKVSPERTMLKPYLY